MQIVVDQTWDGRAAEAGEGASLELSLSDDVLVIEVEAHFFGDVAPDGPPGATAGLWDYEVVELFLVDRAADPPRYTEIELGPHGHHLVLQLVGVRNAVASGLPLQLEAHRDGHRWRATAAIDRALLPARITHYNAYAIHGSGPQRRYLAAHPVPGPAPDFHRLAHFAPFIEIRGI